MSKLGTLDWIALILTIIGGLNWGLAGLMNWNLVTAILGDGTAATIAYDLVGLSALYILIISPKLKK